MGKITKLYHSDQNEDIVLTIDETDDKLGIVIRKYDAELVRVTLDEEQVINLIYDLQDTLPKGTII